MAPPVRKVLDVDSLVCRPWLRDFQLLVSAFAYCSLEGELGMALRSHRNPAPILIVGYVWQGDSLLATPTADIQVTEDVLSCQGFHIQGPHVSWLLLGSTH